VGCLADWLEDVLGKLGGGISDVGLNLFESGVKRSVQQSF
jgi:hypothetical protein